MHGAGKAWKTSPAPCTAKSRICVQYTSHGLTGPIDSVEVNDKQAKEGAYRGAGNAWHIAGMPLRVATGRLMMRSQVIGKLKAGCSNSRDSVNVISATDVGEARPESEQRPGRRFNPDLVERFFHPDALS